MHLSPLCRKQVIQMECSFAAVAVNDLILTQLLRSIHVHVCVWVVLHVVVNNLKVCLRLLGRL